MAFILITILLSTCCLTNKEVTFSETDLPISIPFAGNSYLTVPSGSDFIDNYRGKFKTEWTDKNIIISSYFRVDAEGELNIGFEVRNKSGTSTIRFTIDGKKYDLEVIGDTTSLYGITIIN